MSVKDGIAQEEIEVCSEGDTELSGLFPGCELKYVGISPNGFPSYNVIGPVEAVVNGLRAAGYGDQADMIEAEQSGGRN